MEKITFYVRSIVCAITLLFSFNASAQTTIGYYDFESGSQGWTIGGDAGSNSNSDWACDGNGSIWVKDDKVSSVVTSPSLDVSTFASISISFCFTGSTKIDDGEGFDLKYFDGSTWITLNTYRRNTDFTNVGSSNQYSFTYSILNTSYNFPSNAQFRFEGESSKHDEICYFDTILIKEELIFFDGDSDFDGVTDSVDIDDDNDGILDTDECNSIVNPPLSNADFEDLDILTLDGGGTDVVPTSGIWKGDATNIPSWLSADATNNYLEIWHNTQAASNDAGGQAYSGTHWAEVNATTNDGLYQEVASTPGDVLQWTFAHRKRTGYAGSATEDIVRLMIGDPSGSLTSQGDYASAGDSSWTLHSGTYAVPAGQTTTRLTFTVLNTASGSTSSGNFIDNVQLFVIPTTCVDTDGDSIPDYFDLDSDNDGIPDIVEAGLGSISAGTATIPLALFIDTNNNGMHDAFETNTPLDSDNDGAPNFRDLDSDNDAVFDVDEARTERYVFSTLTLENGDGDINGDGVGNGIDSEAFREKDDNADGTLEYFGDGILDIYDYGTGANEYGNLSQGSGPYYVNNADAGANPDYIDLDSNNDGVFDIAETHYANLDANNDGLIDDTVDTDGDGLVDLFDTNDTAFGSPRDLEGKLDLFFDGRNDYVEDTNVMDGWSEATLMAWIKIDPAASGTQIIFGQNSFFLQLNPDKTITANANGNTVSNGSAINTDQWTHVAATYSNTKSTLIVFINGQKIAYTAVSGPLPSDSSSLSLGRQPDTNSNYFNGYIDEARVFFKALAYNELQKMVYQEIEDNGGVVKGAIIPTDVTNLVDDTTNIPLVWSNLKRYYRMDAFKDNVLDDLTTPEIDEGAGAKIYNTKVIEEQTAPLPFITQRSGRLEVAVNDAVKGINGDDAHNNASAIVKIQHDEVYVDSKLNQVGLIIDEQDSGSNPIKFKVLNDSELNVSWYLKLDGTIDLEGESQLVQTLGSDLDVTSTGTLERDQQGTADTYTYNYWSSPVGVSNITTNNNSYNVTDVFTNVNFLTSGYNGTAGETVGIADYWIWKFANNTGGNYSLWQHVRSTGTLKVGEGFTMKGPGTGSILTNQNYVFNGKPNNGDINLTISAGNNYLVGNPYPSAIDAEQFILDNGSVIDGVGAIDGTLYFWEHWGGGSHTLSEYQGGYGTYTLAGGTPSASLGSNDPDVGTGGIPTKTPGRYIPVGQGFFVVGETDGTINFNNGQRIFQKEQAGTSVFMRASNQSADITAQATEDLRMKFRIGFNSINTIHRQLLLTVDENTSAGVDWGYDGKVNDDQMDDLSWILAGEKYNIQAIDEVNAESVFPLVVRTNKDGLNNITIDELINVPTNIDIYVHDKELNIHHDLRSGDYEFFLLKGEYLDRFEITFNNNANLSTSDNEFESLEAYFSNASKSIVIVNPTLKNIISLALVNMLGQTIYSLNDVQSTNQSEFKTKDLSSGAYIIKLETETGTFYKKVLVE